MLIRLLIAGYLLGSGTVFAQQSWRDLYEPQTINGMPFRVMRPIDFDPQQKYPVVVSLHGAGGKGKENRKQLRDWNQQLADADRRASFPCYVVAPQADDLWNADDLKNIKALIATLPAVDRDRIYVMGHSMGGHGTYIFIQLDPNYFAAAAPSAGSGLRKTEPFIDAKVIKDLPIWAFHGSDDRVCPFEKAQTVFDEVKSLDGMMKLTVWEGDGHGVSRKMIVGDENGKTLYAGNRCDRKTDFLSWMFSQSRKRGELHSTQSVGWKKHVIVAGALSLINSAVANDFDRDGFVDVISSYDGRVVLLRGPDWSPQSIHAFVPGLSRNNPRTSCIHSCLMDVDQDGDLDFCGSNNTVFWLECPDDPSISVTWKYRTIDDEILGTHCLTVGDVDGDGVNDLIANSGRTEAQTSVPNSLTWLSVPQQVHSSSSWIRHVFADRYAPGGSHYTGIGDVNGDGRPDISCAAKGGEKFPDGEWFAWWEQLDDATTPWQKHLLSSDQAGATNIHPVDVDYDGAVDFVATRGHGRGVLWFKGPQFDPIEIDAEMVGPHCLATVDLDSDGDVDIATCGKESDGIAVWYENNGHGTFVRHLIGQNQGAYDIRAVDMDGDKDLDLLIAGHTSQNIVWFENELNSN